MSRFREKISKKSYRVPSISKSKQTNKQTQFKTFDDRVKRETICDIVLLEENIPIFFRNKCLFVNSFSALKIKKKRKASPT